MNRNNTGNPIGSKAFPDFEDNVKSLDEAVNAEQDTFQDRLGKSRLTWAGIVKAGSGDPAIAVDAAARAEAAASQVQQDAEQIAHDAAEQAVEGVAVAVDGAVDRAEGAADRAEAAADAATVSADVYPDVASGRAAVADGEQFQVSEGAEIVRYRRDSSVSQTEVARFPSSRMVRSVSFDNNRIRQVEGRQPNLLAREIALSEELPTATVGATSSLITVDGEGAVRVVGGPIAARCNWSVPTSIITTGKVSVYVLIREATSGSGSGGTVRLIQRDAGGVQLGFTDISEKPGTAAFTDREFSQSGISVIPGADRLDLDINLVGAGRVFVAQYPMISDGDVNGYRHPQVKTLLPDDDEVEVATNVSRYGYDLPLDMGVLPPPVGSLQIRAAKLSSTKANALNIAGSSTFNSSGIAAVNMGPGLSGGVILRLGFTLDDSNNSAVGLLFGDESSARGFAPRQNGQLLILDAPSGTTGALADSGPLYANGDRIFIDARILRGSHGDYTVRYFVDFPDGTRAGPYDVSGIESVERAWYGVRSRTTVSDVELYAFRQPPFASEWGVATGGTKIVYVSTTGDDEGNGSSASPFRTIGRGVAEVSAEGGIVEVSGGDYRESVTHSGAGNVWIRSRLGERANILGSQLLTVTKTTGYSQVYQAPLASKPVGMGAPRGLPVIFEWGTPSKPIPAEERHPLQRGRSHRLPYTEMFEAASLADLDTPEGQGMWWWEAGTIYFAATDGGDATARRYEARVRPTFSQSGGGLRMTRVNLFFSSSYGAELSGYLAVTEDVAVFGSYHNGFFHTRGVWHSLRDEAGGNGNDGFNGTVTGYAIPDNDNRITAVVHDPYGHDNGDDGTSYHYRADQTVYGGLFEHNTKADVVHVTGASVTCFNTVARGAAHGFYTATPPDLDGDRVVTTLRCVNTEAYDNQYSYRAASGGVMLCSNVLAANPTVLGYEQSGDGVLQAIDCRFIGEAGKEKGGAVTVITSTLLV